MKLDKFRFARVVGFVTSKGAYLDNTNLEDLDRMIDIDVPAEPVPTTLMNTDFVRQHTDNIFEALIEGRKIDAIRAHRAITALGLKDSKDVIEQFANNYDDARLNEAKKVMYKKIVDELVKRLDEAGYDDAANFIKED